MKQFIKTNKYLIAILLIGLFMRLVVINQSLWLDEAIGAIVVKEQNYKQILTQFPKGDNHPPLYYLTLKAWTDIFGYSEFALRSLSVLFGLLTIFLVYKIAKVVAEHHTQSTVHFPLLATLFVASSPFHIYYSQEARMYSMAAFFAALAVYSFIQTSRKTWTLSPRMKRSSEQTLRAFARKPRSLIPRLFIFVVGEHQRTHFINPWIVFSASITFLVFTDYLPLFLIPVFWLYAFSKKLPKSWWITFFFAHVPLLILGLLWLPIFLVQSERGNWLLNTLPAWRDLAGGATVRQAGLVWSKFTLGRISLQKKLIYYSLIAASSVPFIIVLVRAWVDREKNKLLWLWLTIPLLLGFTLSFWLPAFIYFRFLFIVPSFYLLLSWGISEVKSDKIKNSLIISLLLVNLFGWLIYVNDENQQREQWKQAVWFVEQKASENEVVVFDFPEEFAPYRWYESGIVNSFGGTDSISASKDSYEKTQELISKYDGIFYFEYLYDLTDPNRYVQQALADSGFVLKEKFNQFAGVGSINYYKRP